MICYYSLFIILRWCSGLSSRGDQSMTSASRQSGNSAAPALLLGPPSVLIVRLRGDVYPIETTKSVIQRNADLDVLSEFVVPESADFIPPVGQKFFDIRYIEAQKALHSKGKVNLSQIKGRDVELRGIAEVIAQSLFQSVLCSTTVTDYTRAVLAGVNEFAIDIPESSYGKTELPGNAGQGDRNLLASNATYGVYFADVAPQMTLLQRLVVELRHCGLLTHPAAPSAVVPTQWASGGDVVLAAGADEIMVPPFALAEVLRSVGVWPNPADKAMMDVFEAVVQW